MFIVEFIVGLSLDAWGIILTILGFGAATFQSTRAKRSAELAKLAAEKTQEKMLSFDLVGDLNNAKNLCNRLRTHIFNEEWRDVSDLCSELLQIVAPLINQPSDLVSNETTKKLSEMASNLKNIESASNKVVGESAKPPGTAKIIGIVSQMSETVSIAISEVRVKIGGQNGE